jgi:hypothetical protein
MQNVLQESKRLANRRGNILRLENPQPFIEECLRNSTQGLEEFFINSPDQKTAEVAEVVNVILK